jgi:raffinose/stachyose/melibiose transport system substrate-binding protein
VEGEENQGLCTGSENYWCIKQERFRRERPGHQGLLAWVITSDEGRDAMANKMGFVTPFKTFDEGYSANNALI